MVTVENGIAQANRKPPTQFQPLHIHGMSLSAVTSMERRPMPLALKLELRKCSGSLLTTETAKSFLLCPLILFLVFLLWKKKKENTERLPFLLWDWNENLSFPVMWTLLSFPNLLAY